MGKHSKSTKKNKPTKANKTTKTTKKTKKKKSVFKKILTTLIIIIVILAGVFFALVKEKMSKINYVELDTEDLGISETINKGYRNIALFAVDSRNIKSDDGSRSDGIIIISINENNKTVKMVSVYRDTFVQVDGHGLTKITHAYAYGGPTLAIKTLNQNLDLDISEFVSVNFDSVSTIVDRIGGIEITIEKDEVSQMNKYIKETAAITGKEAKTIPKAGTYTLDGVQAVTYGRIRKTEGGDYKRTERMRTVIMKTFEKVKKMDLSTLNKIVNDVFPKIQTNISSGEIISKAAQIKSYKIDSNLGWPYETKGKTLDAWYGVPVTLKSNVEKLHQELFDDEDYEASETVKDISNKIIKKTGISE